MAFPPSSLRSWDWVTQPLAFTREEKKIGAAGSHAACWGYCFRIIQAQQCQSSMCKVRPLQHSPVFPIFGDV